MNHFLGDIGGGTILARQAFGGFYVGFAMADW